MNATDKLKEREKVLNRLVSDAEKARDTILHELLEVRERLRLVERKVRTRGQR